MQWFLPIVLLLFLIVPRIVVYLNQGPGVVGTDATARYFPQVDKQSQSLKYFFTQTGAPYSSVLLFFKTVSNNMVGGTVILQHIIGLLTAFMIFIFFHRVNRYFAFMVSFLVFSSRLSVGLEHYISRESLTSFLLIALVFLMFYVKEKIISNPIYKGFLAGCVALLLFLFRIEYIVLVVFLPLLLVFIIKKYRNPDAQFSRRYFLKYFCAYFTPFLIIGILNISIRRELRFQQYTRTYFNIAFHSLNPQVFEYGNSNYPELLEDYRKILKLNKTVTKSMGQFYKVTEKYLLQHPELKMRQLDLMDRIFVEMIIKNPINFFKSYLNNLKSQALGNNEHHYSIKKQRSPTGIKIIDGILYVFTWPTYKLTFSRLNIAVFYIFLLALPVFIIKRRILPEQIIVALFITTIHLLLISGISNAIFRFRYPIDSFLFSIPLYFIIVFGGMLKKIFKLSCVWVKNKGMRNGHI